jgi:hypothetical protein
METYLDQFSVHSLLPSQYAGEAFHEHDLINHTLAELKVVVTQNRRPGWLVASSGL